MAEDLTPSTTARIERSFAFVDLSGFTAFTDREGDDRVVEVLMSLRRIVREIAGLGEPVDVVHLTAPT